MTRGGRVSLGAAVAVLLFAAAPAAGALRLAAPEDCLTNAGCGLGLKQVYGRDVSAWFVALADPDSGIQALDAGLADVAVSFTTTPQTSRSDLITLRDDRAMVKTDHVVPVVRAASAKRAARPFSRALATAGEALTTPQLRALNASLELGRMPEAVGGEFALANGLRERSPRRGYPTIVIGFTTLAESNVLAEVYAASLRSSGFRVKVKPVNGLRPAALAALRARKIDMYLGYARSLAAYLEQRVITASSPLPELRKVLRKRQLRAMFPAAASNQNVFVVKRATAEQYRLSTLSDLATQWPAVP